jgi:hypothetical protein
MPNSQIDMVVKDDQNPGKWVVCGRFKEDPDGQVDVYVVVRQGNVVVRGVSRQSDTPWRFPVTVEGGELDAGDDKTAIASAVAIAQGNPSGLEVFTWVQRIRVLERRTDAPSPTPFGDGTPPAQSGGDLAMGHSVASSLAVSEPTGPAAAPDGLSYTANLKVH